MTPEERWVAKQDLLYKDRPCLCEHKYYESGGRLHGVTMGPDWFRITTEPKCWHHGTEAQAHYKDCVKRFNKTGDWAEFHVERKDA